VPRIQLVYGVVVLALTIAISCGSAFAQGFDWSQLLGGGPSANSGAGSGGGLSQLFGGGNGAPQGPNWNRPAQPNGPGISVERDAPPFTGKFSGTQNDQGAQTTITAQFACYPASDTDIPQARAFVCYTAPSKQTNTPAYGPPPNAYGPPPGGRTYGANGSAPNAPPPDIE